MGEGLADTVAGETAICTVGKEGVGLTYRGYNIQDLAKYATFEEVAYLLIYGHLPHETQLKHFQETLNQGQNLPNAIKKLLELLPANANPMDVLRTACSMLGCLEPENSNRTAEQMATRLIPFCISALLYWYHIHKGKEIVADKSKNLAEHFLKSLHGTASDPELVRALDVSLILYAEHEFNASTFAARVCCSTESDFYSGIVAAIGTLRGPLHGGANEAAMDLINEFKTVSEVEEALNEKLNKKQLIMGFGHRVYKKSDPRTEVIKDWAKKLAERFNDLNKFKIAEEIERIMWINKKLLPNLDFYSALVYYFLDIPKMMFTPLFVISRLSGWSAHIIEQRHNNRLIRPLADYIGPKERAYVALSEREK